MNKQQIERNDPARFFDLIYYWKDYNFETKFIFQVLDDAGVQPGCSLLEAGCGTGTYLMRLMERYQVSGFDLDPSMIEVARGKLPAEIPLFVADMADFSVAEPVEVILALFGAPGYLLSDQKLAEALACFYRGLKPGGVLILDPFSTPDRFQDGEPFMVNYDSPKLKLCRMCVTRQEGEFGLLDFYWQVARADEGVEQFRELLKMRLYTHQTLIDFLERAGFVVQKREGIHSERTLLVAQKDR